VLACNEAPELAEFHFFASLDGKLEVVLDCFSENIIEAQKCVKGGDQIVA
jgi:hypothetical protein